MEKKRFGTLPTGEEIYAYTFANDCASVTIMTRGATIIDFTVFGRSIVGGFADLDTYLADTSHQGAVIGRVANRIGNATFTMDGKTYHVTANNGGKHCLHGGRGFDYRLFSVKEVTENSITLTYTAEDGEEGFPSRLHVSVTYTLVDASLQIDYSASPEGKTPIVLTNHAYFHLDGFGGTVLDHTIRLYGDKVTEVDEELIPTGKRLPVAGTPYDLNAPTKIGKYIGKDFNGYDIFYHTKPETSKVWKNKSLGLIAEVDNGKLKMNVYTDQPGVQFYSATNMTKGPAFKGGIPKIKYGAFCLETHTEPNAVSRGENWYDVGETYTHSTVYEIVKL